MQITLFGVRNPFKTNNLLDRFTDVELTFYVFASGSILFGANQAGKCVSGALKQNGKTAQTSRTCCCEIYDEA